MLQLPRSSKCALTEEFLQLHDGRISTNSVHSLYLLSIHAFLKHFAIRSVRVMLVRHDDSDVVRSIRGVDCRASGLERRFSAAGLLVSR